MAKTLNKKRFNKMVDQLIKYGEKEDEAKAIAEDRIRSYKERTFFEKYELYLDDYLFPLRNSGLHKTIVSYVEKLISKGLKQTSAIKQRGAKFSKLQLMAEHSGLSRHFDVFECDVCKKKFGRKSNLDKHFLRHQDPSQFECQEDGKVFTQSNFHELHAAETHAQSGGGAAKRPQDDAGMNNPRRRGNLETLMTLKIFYNIRKVKETGIEKFRTKASYYKIIFRDREVQNIKDISKTLKMLFSSIIQNITQSIASSDLVRF